MRQGYFGPLTRDTARYVLTGAGLMWEVEIELPTDGDVGEEPDEPQPPPDEGDE